VPNHNATRPTVILNMERINTIVPVDHGDRVFCTAGVGISTLANYCSSTFGRESHSVLGSVFLNPTVSGGVAFNSGGTQLRKGPAYTERALFARVLKDGTTVEVVNELGLDGVDEPNEIDETALTKAVDALLHKSVTNIGDGTSLASCSRDPNGVKQASNKGYCHSICQHNSNVSRYNADTKGPCYNRCEGKVLLLATIHDTFPKPTKAQTYWISFQDLETALAFRKEVCLTDAEHLPTSLEYMDRDAFDVVNEAGRVLVLVTKTVGTGGAMGNLWNIKLWIESLPLPNADIVCDFMMYWTNYIFSAPLPKDIMKMSKEKEHHLLVTVANYPQDETTQSAKSTLEAFDEKMKAFATQHPEGALDIFECQNEDDLKSIQSFRFAAAPAFRTYCVGNGLSGISVDYALPKNGGHLPPLGTDAAAPKSTNERDSNETPLVLPTKRMRYSHFGCNVVHEDLAYHADVDVHDAMMRLKLSVEKEGGKLPAEHGHGTEYAAPPDTKARWKAMDPSNAMNPGVGGLGFEPYYKDEAE
jgi:D-lactate dehydrogenase